MSAKDSRTVVEVGPEGGSVVDDEGMTNLSVSASFDRMTRRHRITMCAEPSDFVPIHVKTTKALHTSACVVVVSIESRGKIPDAPKTGLGESFLEVPSFEREQPFDHVVVIDTDSHILAVVNVRHYAS